jgi:hypothetical protein
LISYFFSSGFVKVFGRLHDDPIRARRRQAYEKRQWTKSREVERLQSGALPQRAPASDARMPWIAARQFGDG